MDQKNKEFVIKEISEAVKQDVLKGERVTDQNITTKRPFYDNNLPASDFFLVANAGYVFTENLKKDDFLTNNFIKKGVKVD